MSITTATLLERNVHVVEAHNPIPTVEEIFRAQGSFPTKVAILTCADPRCNPQYYFNLNSFEALIFRNAGGRATPDAIKGIVAIDDGTNSVIEEIAVVHHTDCGAFRFDQEKLRQLVQQRGVSVEEATKMDFGGFKILEQGLKDDLAILRNSKMLRPELARSARGFTYDISTGKVAPLQE